MLLIVYLDARMLTHADVCWRMLAYAYADGCWRRKVLLIVYLDARGFRRTCAWQDERGSFRLLETIQVPFCTSKAK